MTSTPQNDDPIRLARLDERGLAAVADVVAALLAPGDAIVLTGELASGKTTFVRYLCHFLSIKDSVTSPTFTLAHFYAGPRIGLIHVDAYRLDEAQEFSDLTLDDFLDDHALVVEWGGKFMEALPPALEVTLTIEDATRRTVELIAHADAWRTRLPDLRARLKDLTS